MMKLCCLFWQFATPYDRVLLMIAGMRSAANVGRGQGCAYDAKVLLMMKWLFLCWLFCTQDGKVLLMLAAFCS